MVTFGKKNEFYYQGESTHIVFYGIPNQTTCNILVDEYRRKSVEGKQM